MSKQLITITPETPIAAVAETIMEKEISSLIIVDKEGNLQGIVTKADLTSYFAYRGTKMFNIHNFMTVNVFTVEPTHSIFSIARKLYTHKISRIVVTDSEKKPVGIITLTDLAMISRTFKAPQGLTEEETLPIGAGIPGISILTAKDIMISNPISIDKDEDLSEAARLMTRHGISGLPVIDKSGTLKGIVTKSDIIRAIASMKQ
jgi:CBS domain-containing protein